MSEQLLKTEADNVGGRLGRLGAARGTLGRAHHPQESIVGRDGAEAVNVSDHRIVRT